MARPRKPTALLALNGAFKKDPQRFRARTNEPRPNTEIGDPPADFLRPDSSLAARHLRIWHEFSDQAPAGVLTGCDRAVLANACRIQASIESGGATPAMFAQLRGFLNDMGMTPAGRSRVSVVTKRESSRPSEWEKLARETRSPRAN